MEPELINLKARIASYQKAGEELRNAAAMVVVNTRIVLSLEQARELQDFCLQGELDGARAERTILSLTDRNVLAQKVFGGTVE